MISTDAAGNIDFMNAAAEWLTNCSADDAAGRPLQSLFTIVDAETGVEYGGISGPAAVRQDYTGSRPPAVSRAG